MVEDEKESIGGFDGFVVSRRSMSIGCTLDTSESPAGTMRRHGNNMLLNVTIDHQVIFSWAQRRGAHPSTFDGDERRWPLVFSFGSADTGLEEISWERFFAEFERAGLAFIYRDASPNGEVDDFHEFVKRAAVPELIVRRSPIS